jgi:hypothetical protein
MTGDHRFSGSPVARGRHARPSKSTQYVRSRRRLAALGMPKFARRAAAFGLCFFLVVWTWWDAQASGYAGLPVNMLGQVIGDFLLMGLATPLGSQSRTRRPRADGADRSVLGALTHATRRIQLLDLGICLAPPIRSLPDRNSDGIDHGEATLTGALAEALENNVRVEVLLPAADAPSGRQAARELGLGIDAYRQRLALFHQNLAEAAERACAGVLIVRYYDQPTAVSLVRCDDLMLASLHCGELRSTHPYLSIDHDSENARALRSYFDRLYAESNSSPGPAFRR